MLLLVSFGSQGAYTWISHDAPQTFTRERATGFVIGDYLYFGTGYQISTINPSFDFWSYNTVTGVWTQVADINGARHGAVGFSHNGKGYVCSGHSHGTGMFYNDLQEYDPVANNWTPKASLPATGRYGAVSFKADGKGYVVGGNLGSASGPYSNDVFAYDFSTDTWSQRASYPAIASYYRTSFEINDIGYVGSGVRLASGQYTFYNDFYGYNPFTDSWSAISPYPGGMWAGMSSVVFQQKAFVGLGTNNTMPPNTEFYIYDPVNNSWSPGPSFISGSPRAHGVELWTATRAFIGTGLSSGNSLADLWELNETVSVSEVGQNEYFIFQYPNEIIVKGNVHPQSRLELYDLSGKLVALAEGECRIHVTTFDPGIYVARYSVNNRSLSAQKILIQ